MDRVRSAEEWFGWRPVPQPPLRFRRALARAGKALADYVLDADKSALPRMAKALDRIVDSAHFGKSPKEFRIACLNRAGIAHNWMGVDASNTNAELTTARELFTAGLAIVEPGSHDQARFDYNLGNTLLNLYQRVGDPELLGGAERHCRRAVENAAGDQRLEALCRTGLGSVLRTRIRADGDLSALREALHHVRIAVATAGETPMGHRFKFVLAELLSTRHEMHGGLGDLDEAIALLADAARVRDHMMSPGTLNPIVGTMGTLLRRRFLRTRDPEDLDTAIRLMRELVDGVPDPVPPALTNLGNALLTRYEHGGGLDDLREALDMQLRAVAATKPGDWQAATRHNNAGNALTALWRATGDPHLGDMAVREYRAALELTHDHAPERTSREYNLARALHTRGEESGDPTLLAEAVDAYDAAVRHGLDTAYEWALAAAQQWGAWAAARGDWAEASTAYAGATEAAERLFRTQLLRRDKELWLIESQGLPAVSAYALFRVGAVEDAVVALEAGRGMLLSEVLDQDRARLDDLVGTEHEPLVERYRAAVAASDEAARSGSSPSVLRAARETVEEAIDGIREIPGHERFLHRPDISDVRRAVPADSVVLYLVAGDEAGVAFTMDDAGEVRAVDLPATVDAVAQRAQALLDARDNPARWEGTLDAVTRWAWSAVVEPALAAAGTARRIVLIPFGFLAMLPLHAAWRPGPDGARRYLLDERIVGYAPNIRALEVAERLANQTSADQLAIVVDPETASGQRIGYAEAEAAWVRRWFAEPRVLRGRAADHGSVLTALSGAQVHHFICHGIARPDDPVRDALVLSGDDELTLAEILSLRLTSSGVRLAVLSACDTDRPGTVLPDEVVGFPTGLIQAGFPGVVATQWAVRSEATSLLMARFYQLWRADRRPPHEALCAAQRWLRDTTNEEKIRDLSPAADTPALRSLVRTLRLRDPKARAYGHPAHWAAFSFHGC
ncbi:CHAT domain-containing protein [Streptoalloteichus hindustanus]|uniref:CHAT domain-containing protein n=1 Tax=Streptoalloteichus hindustanus TaxID=2017 RepID=A0A1M5F838_STRHI|nr:CHAT domain-containing protein [Streptoalloteichus hindustanus]SHF87685.1 CHAT domain-containing protein [Streptoalloteichus hindustanus]